MGHFDLRRFIALVTVLYVAAFGVPDAKEGGGDGVLYSTQQRPDPGCTWTDELPACQIAMSTDRFQCALANPGAQECIEGFILHGTADARAAATGALGIESLSVDGVGWAQYLRIRGDVSKHRHPCPDL